MLLYVVLLLFFFNLNLSRLFKKKQDNLLKESQQINKHLDYTQTLQKSKFHVQNEMKECKSFVQTQAKYFDLIAKENCEGMINKDKSIDGVPESVDQMGVKGMTSFYRAKIKAMQQDFDKLQLELKTKVIIKILLNTI